MYRNQFFLWNFSVFQIVKASPYCLGKKLVEFDCHLPFTENIKMPNAKLCVLTRFLLSFFPCIRTIWHRNQETWKNFLLFSLLFGKKVGIFGICWAISEILTDLESAFKSGSIEHLQTIVAWILATRTFLLTQFLRETFDFVKSIWKKNTLTFPIINSIILIYFLCVSFLIAVHLVSIFSFLSN